MNLPTYTVYSVHGFQQTFPVNPNGTIDTGNVFVFTATQATPVATEPKKELRREEKTRQTA